MRVVVVGGSSSVGRVVVAAFRRSGADVVATYNGSPIADADGVHWLKLDLRDAASFEPFTDDVVHRMGPPDVAVFLSGVLPGKSLLDYTPDLAEQVMNVNLTAQAMLMKALLPALSNGGQFLVVGSISGDRGSFDPIYAASKAALVGLVRSLATWHGSRARFNCVAPALIEDSGMFEAMSPERREHHRKNNPTGQLLGVSDLADIIVDLTQPHWKHMNGAVIRLNGGADFR